MMRGRAALEVLYTPGATEARNDGHIMLNHINVACIHKVCIQFGTRSVLAAVRR
jgi:hypothetical protein